MQESERHAHHAEFGKVLLDLRVKEDADEQQPQADESKKPHRPFNRRSRLGMSDLRLRALTPARGGIVESRSYSR